MSRFNIAQLEKGFNYVHNLQTCPSKCAELTPCVQCQQFESGPLMDKTDPKTRMQMCELCPFKVIEVEDAEEYIREDERICTFMDDDECRLVLINIVVCKAY